MERFSLAARIAQNDFDIATELPEDLAACATGRREIVGFGGDGDAPKFSGSLGDGLEYRDPLRAQGQPITGVFYVAAGVDTAGFIFERSAYAKFRKWRVGVFARGEGD